MAALRIQQYTQNFTSMDRRDLCKIQYEPHEIYEYIYISTILISTGCLSLQRLVTSYKAVRILYYIDLLIHLPDPSTVNGIGLAGIVA